MRKLLFFLALLPAFAYGQTVKTTATFDHVRARASLRIGSGASVAATGIANVMPATPGTQLITAAGVYNWFTGTITFAGDVAGPYNNLQIGTATVGANELASTTVTPGTYGSGTAVPVVTVDADGRVTGVTTAAVSGGGGTVDSTDIRFYGAVGDGVTDNTTAIQNALNQSKRVHIPKGIYVTQGLTVRDSQFIYGDGAASVLVQKSGSTGYLMTASVNYYVIRDLSLRGLSESNKKYSTSSSANRSAIKAYVNNGTNAAKISNLHISGFDSIGISVLGPVIGASGFVIQDCEIRNTYLGVQGFGEYWKLIGTTIASCRYGINIQSANIALVGNTIDYCGNAVSILAGTGNSGHGILSSNLLNHNTVTLYANVTTGFTIMGNQMFYGNVHFVNCTGLIVQGNTIYCDTLTINSSGENHLTENYFYQSAPVILRVSTTGWILKDNFYTGGGADTYIDGSGTALQNGNSFNATLALGTKDNQKITLKTNNTNRVTVSNSANSVGIGTTSPNVESGLHVATTNSIILPNGTTAQRPSLPIFPMIRGNSDSLKIEFYNGAVWRSLSTSTSSGGGSISEPSNQIVYGTGTGVTSSSTFIADATNSRLKVNTTVPVYIGGLSGAGSFPGLWFTDLTPSFSNYNLLYDGGDLVVNTVTGKSIYYRTNNATWAYQTGATLTIDNNLKATGALGEAAEYVIKNGSNLVSFDLDQSSPFIGVTNGTVQAFSANADPTDGATYGAYSNHPVTLRSGGNFRRLRISAAGGFAFGSTYYTTDPGINNLILEGKIAVGASTIAPSSVVDINSTTGGLLPPRMTTTQRNAIASPATGLEIFNLTTAKKNIYNGTAWGEVVTGMISGSFSGVGTATTTFTVTIGTTQANTTYKVNATPTNLLAASSFFVTNKTTTTFDVSYLTGLTGAVTFDWAVFP